MSDDSDWLRLYAPVYICDRCLHHRNCHFCNERGEMCCTACGGGRCLRTTSDLTVKGVPT